MSTTPPARYSEVDMAIRPRLSEESGLDSIAHIPFYEEELFYLPRQMNAAAAVQASNT